MCCGSFNEAIQQKFQAYQANGVGEYWIVDPVHETIEVWLLSKEGQLTLQGAFGSEDKFKSATLDEEVEVMAIFAAT
jgi:Uma2 family endonuclease